MMGILVIMVHEHLGGEISIAEEIYIWGTGFLPSANQLQW